MFPISAPYSLLWALNLRNLRESLVIAEAPAGFIFEMSQTFNQTTHGENNTPVQNTGQMDLTVNNNHRDGDKIEISGKVGAIGSVGGSNIQNTLYSEPSVENTTSTGN